MGRFRRAHVGRKLCEGAHDSSIARFDVTRILELTNERRSVSEQCSCLVAVRDDQRTERRQPDRKRRECRGDLASRRFGCQQTFESVLLNTLRYRYRYRLLVVHALDPCDGLSRGIALDIASVDVRLSVGRGCDSSLAHRAVMRLEVSRRGCGCVCPACSCGVRCRVRVMVVLLSRRLLLVVAEVNVCLSVGRSWAFKREFNAHPRRLMYAACRLAVVAPTRPH